MCAHAACQGGQPMGRLCPRPVVQDFLHRVGMEECLSILEVVCVCGGSSHWVSPDPMPDTMAKFRHLRTNHLTQTLLTECRGVCIKYQGASEREEIPRDLTPVRLTSESVPASRRQFPGSAGPCHAPVCLWQLESKTPGLGVRM